ncbi:MAG: histidine kinase [Verrucomicrobiota bacterium]
MVLPLRLLYSGVLLQVLLVGLPLADATAAGDGSWDERLAGTFSQRLKDIDRELVELTPQLAGLPRIPIDDQGGTGGFASLHSTATPPKGTRYAVEVRWPAPARVDLVALVPARRYDARGLDAQYGMPGAFKVELIDAKGAVLAGVARESKAWANPVRKGHPFVYQVNPPLEAAGVRITAELLPADTEGEASFVHAWAEVFAFEGSRNVAYGGDVHSLGGVSPSAPWHWALSFLVDGQTPLGLPEVAAEEHGNIGWISEGRDKANAAAAMTVDLGAAAQIDAVRLLPARKPTSDLPSGFGFPRKFSIAVSATGEVGEPGKWAVVAEREMRNPGHNPVTVAFKAASARFVKIEATELWKAFEGYPAFFALSEVEVLAGDQNLALGKVVRSPDGMMNVIAPGGHYWSNAALSDGFGPDGRLVTTREWLTLLDRRLRLETRCHELRAESASVVGGWRSAERWGVAVLVLAGGFLIIALPIRHRRHVNQELLQVRERIAGDLHDEVGSNLGSIQMFADLAEGRSGPSEELKRIQRIAGETVSAVRDIVWLLRPQGDHRIGTVEHLRETASIMLESVQWKFTANEAAWQVELSEEANRHLFLFFREALHNILRHARASTVEIRAELSASRFQLAISDNGVGIAPDRLDRPATLHALRQRAQALSAELAVDSHPETGTRLLLSMPRPRKHRRAG